MRTSIISAIAVAGLAWACTDAPTPSVTNPDLSVNYARVTGGACSSTTARTISSQQTDLYAKPLRDTAQARFKPVVDNCLSNPDSAKSAMLSYIQWTIDNKASILQPATGTKYGALLVHWNTVFPFVGYTGVDAPVNVPTTIFTDTGTAQLIRNPATTNDSVEIFPPNQLAALTFFHQIPGSGDTRPHLFVIYPLTNNCLTGTNLQQFGPCYEFASFPHVSPKFDLPVKVGVCQLLHEGEALPGNRPALGHFNGTFVEIPGQRSYPTFCAHLPVADAGSWNGGLSGVAKRLAWIAKKTFGVETAYAIHGGLGGTGGGMSPFGGVDLEVFHATFSNETVGTQPTAPEVGSWGPVSVTAPGSITVQDSLGALTTTGHVVVLNQAGGACKNCGGLLLQGNLFVAAGQPAAHNGVYEATFIALQDNANMKSASFKLRDSGNNVLAQVSFVVQSNTNKVLFNGSDTGARWVRHIPLYFTIDVDLDHHTASYTISNAAGAQLQTASGVSFLNTTTNFTNISADFGGIDSGVMGWDEIRVVRLQDGQ